MPKYQMVFDTVRSEQKFNVDIDEQETLDITLDEILFELRERGDYLKGSPRLRALARTTPIERFSTIAVWRGRRSSIDSRRLSASNAHHINQYGLSAFVPK